MPIKFFSEQVQFNLKEKNHLKEWINNSIKNENLISGTINFIFTSDSYLLEINNKYLTHNYFTDIITFNYCENKIINGDIFISIETVKNNTERFSVSFIDELHRVMIHGILHLMDYDDKSDKEKKVMREKENYYLDRFKNLL